MITPTVHSSVVAVNIGELIRQAGGAESVTLDAFSRFVFHQHYSLSEIVYSLVHHGLIRVSLAVDPATGRVPGAVELVKTAHRKTAILRGLWDRRYYWRKAHLVIATGDRNKIKSHFCYKCSLGGLLHKCSTCWRTFHFLCAQRFSTVNTLFTVLSSFLH